MDQIVNRTENGPSSGIEAMLELDGRADGRRRLRTIAIAALALLVAGMAAGAWLWTARAASETVHTSVPAERGTMTVRISATGTLQPLTQVDISSELSGVVREVPVRENQRVARGDVLARLDTARLAAQVERAEASVAAAEAGVADAQVTLNETRQALDRANRLAERGMLADQARETAEAERDRANSALQTAEANLAVAGADLKLQQADVDKSTIHAPIDGVVLSRDVDPGQTVASSLQAPILFVIAEDLERMELIATIDEADIGTVAEGQEARFTVDAFPGRTFEAQIGDISYASAETEGVVTYEARLDVDNADLLLRPGMTATVSVVTREADDVLLVPNEAFRYSPPVAEEERGFSLQNVFTGRMGRRGWRRGGEGGENGDGMRTLHVLREGTPRPVQVEPGASDGEMTEIVSGLSDGDPVVTESGPPDMMRR